MILSRCLLKVKWLRSAVKSSSWLVYSFSFTKPPICPQVRMTMAFPQYPIHMDAGIWLILLSVGKWPLPPTYSSIQMMKRVLYGRVLSLDCRSSRIENALLSQIKAGRKAHCQCVIEGIAKGRSSSNPHNFGCYLTKTKK